MCWSRNAARILLVIPVFVLALMAHAGEQFPGKVVGISDGDTISVLRKGKAVKVRLYGIDTLESKQAFGTRARQYTSDLAFGQVVTVAVKDHDRYGRLVAEVCSCPMAEASIRSWSRPAWRGGIHNSRRRILCCNSSKQRLDRPSVVFGVTRMPYSPWEWRKQRAGK